MSEVNISGQGGADTLEDTMVNKGNESYLQNDFKITIKSKVYFYNPLEDELLLFNSRNGNVILTC